MAGFGTILAREAVRQSRRPMTWVLRVAVAAILIAVVLDPLTRHAPDISDSARVGREVFLLFNAAQIALLAPLAPLVVAGAIQEERDDGAFDLLLVSGLTPAQVLWGKVASRLLSLLALVAGGLPVLAIVAAFGGVAPWEVVNAVVGTAASLLTLGSLAGYLALFVRSGPVLPAFGALAWTVPFWGILPAFRLFWVHEAAYTQLVPWAAVADDGPGGLLAAVACFPVIALAGGLGLPVFRILLTDDSEEELGLRSPDVWVLERYRAALALGLVTLFPGLALVGAALVALDPPVDSPTALAITWLAGVWLQSVGTLAFLLGTVSVWGPIRWFFAQFSRPRVNELGDRPPPRVWSNPVAWRELTSRSYAGTLWLVRGLAALWVVQLAVVALYGSPDSDGPALVAEAFTAVVLGMPLVATVHAIDERRVRTLPLLRATTFPAWRIGVGKLAAVWGRTAPWLVLPTGLWLLIWPPWRSSWSDDGTDHDHGPFGILNLVAGTSEPRIALTLCWAWVAGSLLAMTAIIAVLVARTPRAAWFLASAAVFVLAVIVPFGPAILLDPPPPPVVAWSALWFPWVDQASFDCVLGGVPASLVASTAWLGAADAMAAIGLTGLIARFDKDLG